MSSPYPPSGWDAVSPDFEMGAATPACQAGSGQKNRGETIDLAKERPSAQSIIKRITKAGKPAPSLDASILEITGWEKIVKLHAGDDGKMIRTRYWVSQSGEKLDDPPPITADLQFAYELTQFIAPGHVGGVSWHKGVCHAKLDDDPRVSAPTAPLALCIAALQRMAANEEDDDD